MTRQTPHASLLWRGFACLIAIGSAVIIVAGLAGHFIRDRSVPMALLMYLPVLPMSVLAAAFDLARRGRALPGLRFGLSVLAIAGAALTATPMIGTTSKRSSQPGERPLSLLHWNVQWGGGPFRSPQTWAAQRAEIKRHSPDVVILSEAPPADWVDQLVADLGPGATCARVAHQPVSTYRYGLVVCSRFPVHLEAPIPLPNGKGMCVDVESTVHRLRILLVDGKSNPFISRLPFLHAIAELCLAAKEAARPFDVVVGDFNTPSRSLGFDRLSGEGYTLASRSACGWRATFPSWLPIYDIDHVWLGERLRVESASFFNGPKSDHRGQVVRVLVL